MFQDRVEAGRLLGQELAHLKAERPIVFGLPRGGVPVAAEVAHALSAPLEILLVRKIGVPTRPELALGAVVDGSPPVVAWNEDLVASYRFSDEEREELLARQLTEIARRRELYLAGRPPPVVKGRTVIVVDDGLATGATAMAALRGLRQFGPKRLVLAVPVAPAETVASLAAVADDVVVLKTPACFPGVGAFYDDFSQTTDEEVLAIMRRA